MMQLKSEVDGFIKAVRELNPQLGASLMIIASENSFPNSMAGKRKLNLPPNIDDLDKCIISCSLYFLGLQNNSLVSSKDRFSRTSEGKREDFNYQENELENFTQVVKLFPYQVKRQKSLVFRKGIDPKVAAVSNQCYSDCIADVVTYGGALGAGLGVAKCMNGESCRKSRETEVNEEKAKAKEKQRSDEEKAARDRAHNLEKQKRDEKQIEDSLDRNKNDQEKEVNDLKCNYGWSCADNVAVTVPERYREPRQSFEEANEKANIMKESTVLRAPDSSKVESVDYEKKIGNMDSTPLPKDNKEPSQGPAKDGVGNLLTKLDFMGNPIPDKLHGQLNVAESLNTSIRGK